MNKHLVIGWLAITLIAVILMAMWALGTGDASTPDRSADAGLRLGRAARDAWLFIVAIGLVLSASLALILARRRR